MSPRQPTRRPAKKPLPKWLFLVVAVLTLIGASYWLLASEEAAAPEADSTQNQRQAAEKLEPAYAAIDLQPTVDAWLARQAAEYHIQVYDPQAGKIIAQSAPDEVLFAASLYKIYVAYLALLDIQNGQMDPDEILTGGFTRKQCIDKMVRDSHSPCGEAMMATMGQATLNQRVKAMGMTGTYFTGIRTTAADSAKLLHYIDQNRDLNRDSTAFLRDAMLTQDALYKRGLQTGAPAAKWESKVGWNRDINYHDIGIMTLPDGRVFYVAILGQGSGNPAPIADFAGTIYAALMR